MAIGLEKTGDLLQRSQTMIGQAVDRGTGMLADRVEHYVNVARDVGGVLRERGEPAAADFVETLSRRANDVARYLRTSDGTRIWSDAQDFARSRQWLLTGVGFVGGLAIARAVRSTQSQSTWESSPSFVDSYAQPYESDSEQYLP